MHFAGESLWFKSDKGVSEARIIKQGPLDAELAVRAHQCAIACSELENQPRHRFPAGRCSKLRFNHNVTTRVLLLGAGPQKKISMNRHP